MPSIIIFKFSVNCDHWLSTSQGMWLCKLNQQNRPMLAGSWYCCCIVVVYFCQIPPVLQSISQGVNIIEWKCQSLSHVWFFATPWSVACQAPLSMEFSRQEYWSGLPRPSPGNLPDPGIEPRSPTLQADSLPSEPPGKPIKKEGGDKNRGRVLGGTNYQE